MNDNKELLNGFLVDTKTQIATFDQKAGVLLTTIGIVFALLSDFCSIFSSETFRESNTYLKTITTITFIVFCFSAFFAMICYVLVIIPRKKPRIKNDLNLEKHINYYYDCASLSLDDFKEKLKVYKESDDTLIQQVINNDLLCKRKHKFLVIGIYSLIPFAISTIVMIMMMSFIF